MIDLPPLPELLDAIDAIDAELEAADMPDRAWCRCRLEALIAVLDELNALRPRATPETEDAFLDCYGRVQTSLKTISSLIGLPTHNEN
jgi:hypothetical protein